MSAPDYICSYLDISTGHLPQEDMDRLCKQNEPTGPIAYPYDGGCFAYVHDASEFNTFIRQGYSVQLIEAFKLAQRHECTFIRFDCDGARISELAYFDW